MRITKQFAVVMTVFALQACGGGEGGNDQAKKSGANSVAGGLSAVDQAIEKALPSGGAQQLAALAVSENVSCSPSGEVAVSGTVDEGETSGSFDLDLAFNGCEGTNGTLDVVGSYSQTSASIKINGTIEDSECKVVFSQLDMKLDIGGMPALKINGEINVDDGTQVHGDVDAGDVEVDGDVDTSDGVQVGGNVDTEADEDDDGEEQDNAGISSGVTITGSVSVVCGGVELTCSQSDDDVVCADDEEVDDDESDEGDSDDETEDEEDEADSDEDE